MKKKEKKIYFTIRINKLDSNKMKFDLNDYKVEDYDQETIEKYSFPAEKEVILKYMKGE